jgi:hypothetical protein
MVRWLYTVVEAAMFTSPVGLAQTNWNAKTPRPSNGLAGCCRQADNRHGMLPALALPIQALAEVDAVCCLLRHVQAATSCRPSQRIFPA